MSSIGEILSKVYPREDTAALSQSIEALIAKYAPQIENASHPLTEKDVMLICYGDHVQRHGEGPLATLKTFVDQYLKDVINAVHILPFYPYTSDDGFSITDYMSVNPDLGDWQDIEKLCGSYSIMFDAVINHISSKSDWMKGYLENDEAYDNFFSDFDPKTDLTSVTRPRTSPLLTRFEKQNGDIVHLWSTFSADQIDLNYRNPRVLLAVLEVLLFYCAKGAVFIRLDAVGFIWKTIGTSCIHLEETHLLIQLMRKVLEQTGRKTYLITETNVPHQENVSYFGNGHNEAHLVYNFTLPPLLAYSILKQDVNTFVKWGQSLTLPSDEVCFFNFTASHDGVGVRPITGILPDEEIQFLVDKSIEHGGRVSYRTLEDGRQAPYELNCVYFDLLSHPQEPQEIRVAKLLLSQAVLLTMPGLPAIYFPTMIGSQNDHEGVEKYGYNRAINREKLDFDELAEGLSNKNNLRCQVYNGLIELLIIRKSEPCFHPNAGFSFSKITDQVFLLQRSFGQRKLRAIFNLSDKAFSMPRQYEQGWDCLTGSGSRELAPFAFAWLLAIE